MEYAKTLTEQGLMAINQPDCKQRYEYVCMKLKLANGGWYIAYTTNSSDEADRWFSTAPGTARVYRRDGSLYSSK